jgi:nucleoside-diphosphate-sugar epimerase
MVRGSRILLPNLGTGVCNPVYIDDLVDAICLALWAPSAAPHPLLITGPDHVTWGEFFAAHERALGTNSVVLAEPAPNREGERPRISSRLPNPMKVLKGPRLTTVRATVQDRLGPTRTELLKRSMSRLVTAPEEQLAALYAAGAVVSGDAAARVLDFHPAVGFNEGMRRTARYLHWANL